MKPIKFDLPGTKEYDTVLDIEAEIKILQAEQETDPETLMKLNAEQQAAIAKIREDYENERKALAERQATRFARLKELQALKAKQDADAIFQETADLVKNIVSEFEAWNAAHPYQVEDVISAVHAYLTGKGGFLNANDLGLGKTYESIVTLYIISEIHKRSTGKKPNILWLTKTSILKTGGTINEFKRWWPDFKIVPVSGSDAKAKRAFTFELVSMMNAAVITNYETVRTTPELHAIHWDFVVMDEVHKLKGGANSNGPTAIWEAVKNLCGTVKFTMMLSGTPMVNKPQEMWSYLHIFNPQRFPSLKDFENAFCEYKNFAGEFQLAVNPAKILQNALKGQMIRRRRDEVGLQLPELTRTDVLVEHTPLQAEAYQAMREQFFIWLDEQAGQAITATAIIAQLTRLRQINVWPAGIKLKDGEGNVINTLDIRESGKIDECMDIIENAQDQVVVFSTFNEPFVEIAKRCEKILRPDGSGVGLTCKVISGETSKQLDGLEKEFQDGKIDVLCINSSMGEGLNLQKNPNVWKGGASIAVFLDLWWNPARNDQCEGRIHRQGAHQPVTIYRLFVERTIDYFVLDKVESKRAQFDSIMESDEIRPSSDWKDYLEGMI